jgi:oxygen-independent coproporphyrinogen-3 oxidase
MDQGLQNEALVLAMQAKYLMTEKKAQVLCQIAKNNRPYLHEKEDAASYVSIYIGLPFCPSRCYYCSFPGAVLQDYGRQIPPFMEALKKELRALGAQLQAQSLKVENIYLGGGTPTVLKEGDLEEIFAILYPYYISSATREITVEAGRPDTLSKKKMAFLKQMGVNRVCVNPQTMNDATLKRIGRNHDSHAVVEAVQWA